MHQLFFMVPPSKLVEPIEAEFSFKPARFSCWKGGNSCPRSGKHQDGAATLFAERLVLLAEPFFWPKNAGNNVGTAPHIVLRAPHIVFRSQHKKKARTHCSKASALYSRGKTQCENRFSHYSRAPNIVQGRPTMFREISGDFVPPDPRRGAGLIRLRGQKSSYPRFKGGQTLKSRGPPGRARVAGGTCVRRTNC